MSEHDPTYAGLHVVDNEGNCRCGDDPPGAFTHDREGRDYEGACVDASGEPAERLCQ